MERISSFRRRSSLGSAFNFRSKFKVLTQVLIEYEALSPHFISNLTRLEFGNCPENQLMSLKDIMAVFIRQNKHHGKYYFKIDSSKQQEEAGIPSIQHLQSCALFNS